eukprot:CAMPEP_0113948600 /NCGR_PEP_ID=MMETSP1339-20121228/71074_1 /TAXON_ID=94617 /ORGANISM="Fibrocapsa japonica" /LENGTH=141 /DNA_ID=CAMNT_0000955711 /DNA_START=40 /DNA_END=462 /DNA_ORIENTATION=- /assembly_acc=CAM_ASM_000762
MKGALSAVLGFPLGRSTVGVKFSEGNKVRLTVSTKPRGQAPTPEEMTKVMEVVAGKVAEDAPVYVVMVQRPQAEDLYGDCMYDKFEVPESVTELRLVYLESFSLHCSPHPVLPSCAGVGNVQLLKHKFRATKMELELQFVV